MPERAWLRIAGRAGDAAAGRVRERLAERAARGVWNDAEIERVAGARLRVLDSADAASEAFRRCCTAWDVDRNEPIRSHRPVIGPLLVAAKGLVARLLRFQNEGFRAKQAEFNRNLLLILRELLERTDRRRE